MPTFKADIHNCDEHAVDHVGFHYSRDDLLKWQEASEKCVKMGANAIYFSDYRCAFFDEEGEPVNFRADACHVSVADAGFIRFYGFERKSSTEREWYTDRIHLIDLWELLQSEGEEAPSAPDEEAPQ